MANDINKAITSNPIKNGSATTTATVTGQYNTYNYYVKNTPIINDIESKYDNRFYNGIFVKVLT